MRNPFRTEEYEKDLQLVRDLADHFDVVMLAKAGEAYGSPEIRDLSAVLVGLAGLAGSPLPWQCAAI